MEIDEINIMDVARKNNLKFKMRSGASFRGECPFCGAKNTLSITPSRDLFQCFCCNEKGNKVTLEYLCNPSEYNGNDFHKFMKNMEEFMKTGVSADATVERLSHQTIEEDTYRAPIEHSSSVYRAMIKMMTLSKKHLADFTRRGGTKEEAEKFFIRSVPRDAEKIPQALVKKGYDLRGVPGFYKEKGKWKMKNPKGYFCPVFDGQKGLVLGFQIRLDNPIDGNKYVWFSSTGKEEGTSSKTLSSVLPGEYPDTALIVEGTLKGLIVYLLLKKKITIVTIPGNNSQSCLEPIYKRYEGKLLFEAIDMDKYSVFGPQTEKTVRKLKTLKDSVEKLRLSCEEHEITLHNLTWNLTPNKAWTGKGKGLDDFLLEYEKKERFVKYIIDETEKFSKMKKIIG